LLEIEIELGMGVQVIVSVRHIAVIVENSAAQTVPEFAKVPENATVLNSC